MCSAPSRKEKYIQWAVPEPARLPRWELGVWVAWLCSPIILRMMKRAKRWAFLESNNLSADHDRSGGLKGNSKNGNIIVFCL